MLKGLLASNLTDLAEVGGRWAVTLQGGAWLGAGAGAWAGAWAWAGALQGACERQL